MRSLTETATQIQGGTQITFTEDSNLQSVFRPEFAWKHFMS